ncbi:hypothetical protein BGZ73_003617 [Actinomortierella ambigua]|nr:hypothetical protein BGZ73_003617 [Actinomortierella ambigua]
MEDTNHVLEHGQQQPPSAFIATETNDTTAVAAALPPSLEHSMSPEGQQTSLNLVNPLSSIPHHEALLLDQVVSSAQASAATVAATSTFHTTSTSSANILTNGTSIAAAVGIPTSSIDDSTAASLLHSSLGLPPPGATPSDIVKASTLPLIVGHQTTIGLPDTSEAAGTLPHLGSAGVLDAAASTFALPRTTTEQAGAGIDAAAAAAAAVAASVGSTHKVIDVPWQEILADMMAELGYFESRRMMAVEELVLSKASLKRAPQVFAKYLPKLLPMASQVQDLPLHESVKRTAGDDDVDMTDIIGGDQESTAKRRKYGDDAGVNTVLNHASRAEITALVDEFIATKREQINESNRNEFIKKSHAQPKPDDEKVKLDGKGEGSDGDDDDGCARVDARKLNRTIQMRQEVVKNEALAKTNPKGHTMDNNASQLGTNALDERLCNIQEHLNVRLAANPPCTLMERVKILEDMIMQLERDYPPWAALHFNQPNRTFPPPPAVTTVTRGYMNQLLMTGDHLLSSSTMAGDVVVPLGMDVHATPVHMTRAPSSGLDARSLMASTVVQGSGNAGGRAGSFSGSGAAASGSATLSSSSSTGFSGSMAGGALSAQPSSSSSSSSSTTMVSGGMGGSGSGTTGSATVIKLKRHGGGSSSLQRAVQEQLAQRQAMAAMGLTAPKPYVHPLNDPTARTTTTTGATMAATATASSGSNGGSGTTKGGHAANSSNNNHTGSPMMPPFEDLSKPGVTGRGPIKSRRKSIAKGLDPASAMAAMGVVGSPVLTAVNSGGGVTSTSLSGGGAGGSGADAGTAGGPKKARKKRTSVSGPSAENHGGHNGPAGKAGAAAAAAKPPRLGLGKGKMGGGAGLPTTTGRGLGKGKMGGGLGKGKGGAYLHKHYNQVSEEEEEEEEDDAEDEEVDFVKPLTGRANKAAAGRGGGSSSAKAKKAKGRAAVPVRKFGGKSFGMVGGESSGSSNESSDEDGDGSGSSGSQSDSSSSSSLGSGSDLGDSD